MPKKKITYGELEAQLVSQKQAIDLVLDAIKGQSKSKNVSQNKLEDFEKTIKGFDDTSMAKVEMTGRARVSC